jgi:hypothetical protein
MTHTPNVPAGRYKHFKGGTIEVLYTALHTETLEPMVVYKALYECRVGGIGSMWARPEKMFLETVEHEGKLVQRFEQIHL